MTADMMHDAVRGDVLSVLRAASTGRLVMAVHRQALTEDSAALRKALQADAAFAGAPAIVAQTQRIKPLVEALKRVTSGDMTVAIPAGGRQVAAENAKDEQTTLIVDSLGTASNAPQPRSAISSA